jgi:hypothetical protein
MSVTTTVQNASSPPKTPRFRHRWLGPLKPDDTGPLWITLVTAAILGSTYAPVFAAGIEPREWATAITFVAAHLIAAEVIASRHSRR